MTQLQLKGSTVDMGTRYQDPIVSLCLNKASFLDPRFRTLAHISRSQQEEVIKVISDELVVYGTTQVQRRTCSRF